MADEDKKQKSDEKRESKEKSIKKKDLEKELEDNLDLKRKDEEKDGPDGEDEEIKQFSEDKMAEEFPGSFSLGDLKLGSAPTQHTWQSSPLEEFVADAPIKEWVEGEEEELDGKDLYGETTVGDLYGEERGGDIYGEAGRGGGMYGESGGSMYSDNKEVSIYEPKGKGKGAEIGETRLAGPSKLEVVGLQKGFGVVDKEGRRSKKSDKNKYN